MTHRSVHAASHTARTAARVAPAGAASRCRRRRDSGCEAAGNETGRDALLFLTLLIFFVDKRFAKSGSHRIASQVASPPRLFRHLTCRYPTAFVAKSASLRLRCVPPIPPPLFVLLVASRAPGWRRFSFRVCPCLAPFSPSFRSSRASHIQIWHLLKFQHSYLVISCNRQLM